MKIGIFWVYKGKVFGRARDVAEGDEYVQGIIDSPDTHTDYWDTEDDYLGMFPELRSSEYMDVPRGRVLYDRNDRQSVVYMDKALFSPSIKKLVQDFFCLGAEVVVWRTDFHYTTSADEIDRLLE